MSKIIENYCLEEIVGEGQYGKVYKAKDTKDTTKLFAIKVVKIQKFKENPKLEECTINEIRILSKMESNPHVVKFIELLKTQNNYYFVYEYCSGGTLEEIIIKQKFIPEKRANLIMKQLISAFKSLNQHRILHRDLKPSNILVNNDIIKLADFGFCKPLAYKDQMVQTMLGSPIYMAPEVLKGQDYCIKADIWSLGVVYFEMLFGYCPFEERSIAKLIMVLEEQPLKINRAINPISKESEHLLQQLLIKNQEKRLSWEELFSYTIDDQGNLQKPQKNKQYIDVQHHTNLQSLQSSSSKPQPIPQQQQQQQQNQQQQQDNSNIPNTRFIKRAQTIEIKNYEQFQASLKQYSQQQQQQQQSAQKKQQDSTPTSTTAQQKPNLPISTQNLENNTHSTSKQNSSRSQSQPMFLQQQQQQQQNSQQQQQQQQQQNQIPIPEETEFKPLPLGEITNSSKNNNATPINNNTNYQISYSESNKIEYKPILESISTPNHQPLPIHKNFSHPHTTTTTTTTILNSSSKQFASTNNNTVNKQEEQKKLIEEEPLKQFLHLLLQERNKIIFYNKIILETQDYDISENSLEMIYWLHLALNNHVNLLQKTFITKEISFQIAFPDLFQKLKNLNISFQTLQENTIFKAFIAILEQEIAQNSKTRQIYQEQFELNFSQYSQLQQQQFTPKAFREIAKQYIENCQKQQKKDYLYAHFVKIIDAANISILFNSLDQKQIQQQKQQHQQQQQNNNSSNNNMIHAYFDDLCLQTNEELKQKYSHKMALLS